MARIDPNAVLGPEQAAQFSRRLEGLMRSRHWIGRSEHAHDRVVAVIAAAVTAIACVVLGGPWWALPIASVAAALAAPCAWRVATGAVFAPCLCSECVAHVWDSDVERMLEFAAVRTRLATRSELCAAVRVRERWLLARDDTASGWMSKSWTSTCGRVLVDVAPCTVSTAAARFVAAMSAVSRVEYYFPLTVSGPAPADVAEVAAELNIAPAHAIETARAILE